MQSEWLFSAECGSTLNSIRVATANLVLYPIIPETDAKAKAVDDNIIFRDLHPSEVLPPVDQEACH